MTGAIIWCSIYAIILAVGYFGLRYYRSITRWECPWCGKITKTPSTWRFGDVITCRHCGKPFMAMEKGGQK